MNQIIHPKHNFYFYLIEMCFHFLDSVLWYCDNKKFQWSPVEIFSVFFSQEISVGFFMFQFGIQAPLFQMPEYPKERKFWFLTSYNYNPKAANISSGK